MPRIKLFHTVFPLFSLLGVIFRFLHGFKEHIELEFASQLISVWIPIVS